MEIIFLLILIGLMAFALGAGYPVAFALPGAAIIAICIAAISGYLFAGNPDAFFYQGGPGQWLSAGVTNLRGVYWEAERDTLIAIPLFIFMGIMLQRSKIAEDLLVTMAQLFGPVPGGLGISVVFVGALLAATTGIVGATVVAMGLISLPAMLRNKYSQSLSTGTIAASGTLGQIIPPSIVLIILADQLASSADQAGSIRKALHKTATGELSMPSTYDITSTSAGEMFLGAFVPGLVLVVLYMLYILVFAFLNPKAAPTVPFEGTMNSKFWFSATITIIPPLALIFLVLGSIISGIATVNQAGAIGAAGAMVMAGYRLQEGAKRTYWPAILAIVSLICIGIVHSNFNTNIKGISNSTDQLGVALAIIAVFALIISLVWSGWRAWKTEDTLTGVMVETCKATSLVFIILMGAAMLTAAFRAFGGEELVREFLNGMPGGFWSKFIIVMAVIFFLGFFLDFIEISVVVVPIIAPILLADPSANISAVWLGVMIGLNIQTSFLTPPFGFALFYLRGVAPAFVKTTQIYKGVIPFILLQLLALVVVGLSPALVNYLPYRVSYLAATAPPPRNPLLQHCLEQYVTDRLLTDGAAITAAINTARELDLSSLPKKMADNASASFEQASAAIGLLAEANQAAKTVANNTQKYRPIHTLVRKIEADVHKLDGEIKQLKLLIGRMRAPDEQAGKARYEKKLAMLTSKKEELEKKIPAEWENAHTEFAKLTKAEDQIRLKYRRAADASYQPVAEIAEELKSSDALAGLKSELEEAVRLVADNPIEMAEETGAQLDALADKFGEIAGAGSIKSALSSARRSLTARQPNKAKALQSMEKAQETYNEEMAWRSKVDPGVVEKLVVYDEAMIDTLGIRSQEKMSRAQALFTASCNSGHRDVSLNF